MSILEAIRRGICGYHETISLKASLFTPPNPEQHMQQQHILKSRGMLWTAKLVAPLS
jgi:hypothetical protein